MMAVDVVVVIPDTAYRFSKRGRPVSIGVALDALRELHPKVPGERWDVIERGDHTYAGLRIGRVTAHKLPRAPVVAREFERQRLSILAALASGPAWTTELSERTGLSVLTVRRRCMELLGADEPQIRRTRPPGWGEALWTLVRRERAWSTALERAAADGAEVRHVTLTEPVAAAGNEPAPLTRRRIMRQPGDPGSGEKAD